MDKLVRDLERWLAARPEVKDLAEVGDGIYGLDTVYGPMSVMIGRTE